VLAIAGVTTWFGYLVFVYGLSQLDHQNYSFSDLAIPGRFTLGTPAADVAPKKSLTVTTGSGAGGNVEGTPGKGYSSKADCTKKTGLPCIQLSNGNWYGFKNQIKGTS
jgi:hypothetical protein